MASNKAYVSSLRNKIFVNLIAFILGVIFLLPFLIMVLGSFSPSLAYPTNPAFWIPNPLQLGNYIFVFASGWVPRWLLNSAVISIIPVITTVFICTLLGYIFAKKKFVGKNFIFWAFLSMIMIPPHMLVIPRYLLFDKLGWIDTYLVFLVPFAWDVSSMFIMRQYIQTIPKDMEEAAIIDGCSSFRVFLKIIFPLAKPAMATVAIFQFIARWNDLFYPLVFLTSRHMFPMTVGLLSFFSDTKRFGFQMACATINFLPTFIVFVSLQKYFIEGITTAGLKG